MQDLRGADTGDVAVFTPALRYTDLPLEPRELVFAARPPAPRPKTAHPAALGPDRINQYFDAMLTVARQKLALEQARTTTSSR